MILGNDVLGGVKYQRAVMESQRRGDCAGIFLHTFGDAKKLVERMAKSGKFSEIVIHIAPFDGSHAYPISKHKKLILADSAWAEKVQNHFPDTRIMLSPFCEHNHKASAMKPIFAEMKKVAPSCLFVNSIWKGQEVDGTITEIHIEKSKSLPKKPKNEYTVSFDGCGSTGTGDMPDLDCDAIIKTYSDARHIRAWNFQCNGKYGHNDKRAIKDRDDWANVEYLRMIRALLDPREGRITYPSDRLMKCAADDHDDPDTASKDNRLMAIVPTGKRTLKVYDSKNNHIDTLTRTGSDHSGLPKGGRFYSKRYAYQVANIAFKNTGSYLIRVELCPITDGRKRSNLFK